MRWYLKATAVGAVMFLPMATYAEVSQPAARLAQAASEQSPPVLRRYAILVGNGNYAAAPDLPNTKADAQLVGDFLSQQGYQVLEYADLTKRGFEQMLRRLLRDVGKDSEVLFYYAGHGLQIAGGNYLVPVDADLDDANDVPFETVSLTSIVKIIGARARLQMVILDSCRNNPFGNTRVLTDLSSTLSETRDGFNALTAPINSLLVFSTSPGTVAYDGAGDNSPFTAAMVEVARAGPERPVSEVFEDVRRLVYDRTAGRQVPWESSTLVEPLSFGRGTDAALDAAGISASKGLTKMPSAQVVSARAADPASTSAVAALALAARLEPEVAIGAALRGALSPDPADAVLIVEQPALGHLTLIGADDRRYGAGRAGLPGEAMDRLVYATALVETAASTAAAPALTDAFRMSVGGQHHRVEIALEADPCDIAAGDHLDPEGSGLARYPNEIAPEAARAACLAAVAAYPDVGRFHYQLGRAELALRDIAAARAAFERARDLGHTRAWYALGLILANESEATTGRNGGPAPVEALALYREGVSRGDPYAYHVLGKQLLRYGATEAEQREGFELISRAVELGHTFAMNELGFYFLDPDTPQSDQRRGLRYLRESAARGDIYGYNNLGAVYRDGLAGVAADPAAAEAWFVKAAAGGHPLAPGNLGRLWASGALGEDGRDARAVEWYDLGLSRGDAWSGANAAWIIANRRMPGLTLRDAAVRAGKAAALGNVKAAARAREILANLPVDAVDGAAQQLINSLGGDIEVDGAFGPGSIAEMAQVTGSGPQIAPDATPVERLAGLAAAYWRAGALRVDLN